MRNLGSISEFIGSVYLVLTCLIVAARALGSALPPPNGLQQLHLLDCALPCWLGIVPGQTRFEDAAQTVAATFPDQLIMGKDAIHAVSSVGSSYGEIVITTEAGIVRYVLLIATAVDGLTLGDIASLNGVSACTAERSPSVIAAYDSPAANAVVVVNHDARIPWHQTINNIDIRRANERLTCVVTERRD